MVVSSVSVRIAGIAAYALPLGVLFAGTAFVSTDEYAFQIPMLLAIALLGPPILVFGAYMFCWPSKVSERLFIRTLGLQRHERRMALKYELAEAVPFEHRKANQAVASSVYRVSLRARVDKIKVFSRIASTALTGTDAAQLFGPRLDEFVYVFSQSVERMGDRDADVLLALVSEGTATPDDVIAYLGELKSVSATTWALREGVSLEYARALS